MKKSLSIFLTLVMAIAMIPVGVFTASALQEGDYTYSVTDSKATIIEYTGPGGDVTIPATLGETFPVTVIGDRAFVSYMGLTSVTIPNSVNTIGSYAFAFCDGLTSLAIGSGVQTIEEFAFYECDGLNTVTIPNSVTSIGMYAFAKIDGLTSVTILNSNTSFGDFVFQGCINLTLYGYANSTTQTYATDYSIPFSPIPTEFTEGDYTYSVNDSKATIIYYYGSGGDVTIPATLGTFPVTEIGSNSFIQCTGLTSVIIPDSVTTIGDRAFNSCTGLTSLTIGNGVEIINSYAFYNCIGLTSVILPESLITIGDAAFSDCVGLTSMIIPDNVAIIGEHAFLNCGELTSLTIGNGVETINAYAFNNCYGLTSVIIPGSVTTIGLSAFSYCRKLTSLTISNGVTNIGNEAFLYCTELTSVTIPGSVTTIGFCVFTYCPLLTQINVDGSNSNFSSKDGVLFNKLQTSLIQYPPGKLGNYAVPMDVTSICDYAFASCTELNSVIVPNTVTTIGDVALFGCTGLTSLVIPNSVTSIGSAAFAYCSGLTSLTILNSNTGFGEDVFFGSNDLTLYCYANSTSVTYAEENSIPYLLIPAGGNDTVEFTATNTIGQTGAQVTVDVNISALSDSAAGTIVLPFDNTKLRLVSAVAGAALEDAVIEAQGSFIYDIVSTADQTTLAYINQDGLNLGGSVLQVTYEILAADDQTIPIVPSVTELCDSSMETKDLAYNVTNGEIVVDNTHPVVTGVDEDGIYNVSKNPAFTDLNDVTATLNGDAFTSETTVIPQGIYTLIVTDAAGNATTVDFIIDKTAPSVEGVDDDGLYKVDKNPTFTDTYLFTATLDGSTFVSGDNVSEGTHILVVTDLAGNVTTVHFRIDETKPLIATLTPSKYVPTTTLTVSIEYPEVNGLHQYKIGSGEWTLYTGAVTVAYTVLPADRTVFARSTDLAGNTSDESDVDLPNIVRLGDVNLNDEVSVVDALMALHHASGRTRQTAGTNAFFAGDVNSSGTITTIDALKILQFSAGTPSF